MSTTFDQPTNSPETPAATAGSYDQTFATSGRARLHLDNPRGQIRVTGWDRADVHIRAVKRHDASSARYQATQVAMSQDGDTVIARTVLDPSATLAERGALNGVAAEIVRAFADLLPNNSLTTPVDYDVRIPFDSELDLQGVSADIAIEGTRGAFKVRTVSGEIAIRNVQGDADLGSVNGEIEATGLNGRVHVENVSGDASLSGQVSTLHGKTVSGDIELTGPLSATGDYDLKSVSGAVTLRVPASTGATITVRGVSPDVHSDLRGTVTRDSRGPGHREWQGQLRNGGAAIRFQTVSGNLYLRQLPEGEPGQSADVQSDTTVPTAVAQPTPSSVEPLLAASPGDDVRTSSASPDPSEGAELRILSLLERGELTVDDALRQLEALRGH